jgi:hypothetical protein
VEINIAKKRNETAVLDQFANTNINHVLSGRRCGVQVPYHRTSVTDIPNLQREKPEPLCLHVNPKCKKQAP